MKTTTATKATSTETAPRRSTKIATQQPQRHNRNNYRCLHLQILRYYYNIRYCTAAAPEMNKCVMGKDGTMSWFDTPSAHKWI